MLRSICKLNIPLKLISLTSSRSFHSSRIVPERLPAHLPEDLQDKLRQLGEERGYHGWTAKCKPLDWDGKPAIIPPCSCILKSVVLTDPVLFNDEGEPLYTGEFRAHGFGETDEEAFRTAVEKAILMMELEKEKEWFETTYNERGSKEK